MDYRTTPLYQREVRVSPLQVVGIAAEIVLRVAQKVGINSVSIQNVPDTVELYGVEVHGRKYACKSVGVSDADKDLAVKVAKEVRRVLMAHGFNVLAVVQKEGTYGTHDLVCDKPFTIGNGVEQPGLYSGERKLRRILTDSGRMKFRSDLRVESLGLFNAVIERGRGQWAGRFVLLVEFGPGQPTNWSNLRCDLYLHATKQWQGLFGWVGSKDHHALVPASPAHATRCSSSCAAVAPPRPNALQAILKELKNSWVEVNGRRMGSKARSAKDQYVESFEGKAYGWREVASLVS